MGSGRCIGFTGKSAEQFFTRLEQAGVARVIDTRLNNVSQLAGFTKRRDLEFFLKRVAGIDYVHDTDLAPTADMLDDYKKKRIKWDEYETRFNALLQGRDPAGPAHACPVVRRLRLRDRDEERRAEDDRSDEIPPSLHVPLPSSGSPAAIWWAEDRAGRLGRT